MSARSYPREVKIPSEKTSRETILKEIEVFSDLFKIPKAKNRIDLISDFKANLIKQGYQEDPATRFFVNSNPPKKMHIKPTYSTDKVYLPETIDAKILTSPDLESYLIQSGIINYLDNFRKDWEMEATFKDFLAKNGYVYDNNGNLYLRGGLILEPGLVSFWDLVTIDFALEFLDKEDKIPIYQEDLEKLNGEFEDLIYSKKWTDLTALKDDVSQTLKISPELAELVIFLTYTRDRIHEFLPIKSKKNTSKEKKQLEIWDKLQPRLELYIKTWEEKPTEQILPPQFVDSPADQQEFIVNLLQYYPDTRNYLDQEIKGLAKSIIKIFYKEEDLTEAQLFYSFLINYPLLLPESPELTARRERLKELILSTPIVEAIRAIYGTIKINKILRMEEHPLELYLFAIKKAKPDEIPNLVSNFGMRLPEFLTNRRIRNYVYDNIVDYKNVIVRNPAIVPLKQKITKVPADFFEMANQLSEYTDYEIVDFFGFSGGFNNRNGLIEQVFVNLREENFILFNRIDPDRATNTKTTLLTEFDEILSPYIVYGSPLSYRVLELDEIIHAFKVSPGVIDFLKINNKTDERYTKTQIIRLQVILATMRSVNKNLEAQIDELLNIINIGFAQKLFRDDNIKELIVEISQTTKENKDKLEKFFWDLFYAGMYMRRWKGPGYKYPMSSSSTQAKIDPVPISIIALSQVWASWENIEPYLIRDKINYLPIIDIYHNGQATVTQERLIKMVQEIASGSYCIRMASRKLVLSANYYLNLFFNQSIKDFDPTEVDSIS